jgi:hypothetical protein
MWIRHRSKFISLIILGILSLLASFFHSPPSLSISPKPAVIGQDVSSALDIHQEFKLTPKRKTHILYGDGTGGGHKFGTGIPGKTEFPESWNEDKIITTVIRIANDSQLPMRPSGRRYWLRMGEEDGLQIRVVLNRENGEIVTGYPVMNRRNE